MKILSPSFLRTIVSVNFCKESMMNYVAVEDVGSHRECVTEAIAWTTYYKDAVDGVVRSGAD